MNKPTSSELATNTTKLNESSKLNSTESNSNRLNVNSYSSSLGSSPGSASITTSNNLNTPNGAIGSSIATTNTSNNLNSTSYSSVMNNTPLASSNNSTGNKDLTMSEKKKIGHREVKGGVVLYKKVSTNELKKSIQFGIVHFINERNRDKVDRDLLMQDFQVVETLQFPRSGSLVTPAHDYNDFKLKIYAPYGFKYLRRKFNLNEVDFMESKIRCLIPNFPPFLVRLRLRLFQIKTKLKKVKY
jgi:hypothetical protein